MESIPGQQGWGKPSTDYRKLNALFTELQGKFHLETGHKHDGADGGAPIGVDGLEDEAIVEAKIADAAVTTDKIDDAAVTEAKLADAAVTTDKIDDGAVTTSKLADAALSADLDGRGKVQTDFFDDATLQDKVADDAFTEAVLADKVANGAFTEVLVDALFAAGAIDGGDRLKAGSVGADRLSNPQVFDPGRVAIAVLRGSADVVEADTVTIGADVYEFEVVNTDSNDNASGGDFNNTTNPLTVTLDVGAYANLNGALAVGDLARIENEIMRVTEVDGDDVTFQRGVSGTSAAAHADATDIFIGDGIAGGSTVAVGVVTTLTPAAWTNALIADINGAGSENALAVDISDNEVLLAAADAPGGTPEVGAVTLALAETFTNANNEWDSPNMRGGRAAGVRRVAMQTRECTAVEDALGTMHFMFDFAPAVVDVTVYTDTLDQAGGAVRVAWDGVVTVTGNRVTLADGGGAAPVAGGNVVRLVVSD